MEMDWTHREEPCQGFHYPIHVSSPTHFLLKPKHFPNTSPTSSCGGDNLSITTSLELPYLELLLVGEFFVVIGNLKEILDFSIQPVFLSTSLKTILSMLNSTLGA